MEAVPTLDRALEKSIAPKFPGWEGRYYRVLCNIPKLTEKITKEMCVNYLEGLEWTFKYYSSDCPDWKWSYKYAYPPLLKDLIRYIPCFGTTFVPFMKPEPVSPYVQLAYVLPRGSLHMLPKELEKELLENWSHLYPTECEFIWAFCKYFWEAHAILPTASIDDLENVVNMLNIKT
jgi:5'-3' exonuclease